ncbi:MAG: hypothetical protein ABSF41_03705 [Pseudolabrys sp.]|jgi:hypothetical protein
MTDVHAKPPLEDPLHEKEIFASEVVGIAAVHGNFVVTLANTRFDERIGKQPAKMRRIVTGRIVLTTVAANQMLQQLQQIAAQIEATASAVAGHKPN